jgi:hypothetical protein
VGALRQKEWYRGAFSSSLECVLHTRGFLFFYGGGALLHKGCGEGVVLPFVSRSFRAPHRERGGLLGVSQGLVRPSRTDEKTVIKGALARQIKVK